jgi:hypothetical protein|tara:strand:+ start:5520 stop:6905 length:1386 start_codon:yes stop_codon:yes gene_type:complete
MATLSSLNAKLKSLGVVSGFSELSDTSSKLASSVQALNSSSLGTEINAAIAGVQGLNTTLDAGLSVALLTENLTGLQSQVVKDVAESKSDLDKITGAAVNNAFNDLVFASATAEGVKAAINLVATPTDEQLTTIMSNIVPEQFAGQVSSLVTKSFGDFSGELLTAVTSFSSSFDDLLGSITGNVLQDVILQNDKRPINTIENLGVPVAQAGEVLVLLQDNNINEAAALVQKTTKQPLELEEIEAVLATVPTSLEDQIDKRKVGSSSTSVYDVADKNNEWVGAATPAKFFDVVATQEQLTVEMLKCSREITEIIFFGHEMTEDQVLTAEDIHQAYVADNNDGIPFHYVVLPNGNIQRGRSTSKDGSFSTTHDKFSIGIVIPHVRDAPGTVQQGKSVRQVIESFYSVWPGGQVFDANIDTGDSQVKTGVNIGNYIASFKKINHGDGSRSVSTRQLISAAQGNV